MFSTNPFSQEWYGCVKYMEVLRRISSSLQHVNARSLSVVILFRGNTMEHTESAARMVSRFLLGSFLTQVLLAKRSTTTSKTHELSLETMKSISRCPNSFGNGRESIYFLPSFWCFPFVSLPACFHIVPAPKQGDILILWIHELIWPC